MTNTSVSEKRHLRVGLLVDSLTQPRWVSNIIKDIQSSSIARVVLVVKNEAPEPQSPGRLQTYWKNRDFLLYALYDRLDSRKPMSEADAFEDVDVREVLADCPVLGVMPVMKKFSDWFPEDAIEKIREYDLDVAISHGFRILRG